MEKTWQLANGIVQISQMSCKYNVHYNVSKQMWSLNLLTELVLVYIYMY